MNEEFKLIPEKKTDLPRKQSNWLVLLRQFWDSKEEAARFACPPERAIIIRTALARSVSEHYRGKIRVTLCKDIVHLERLVKT